MQNSYTEGGWNRNPLLDTPRELGEVSKSKTCWFYCKCSFLENRFTLYGFLTIEPTQCLLKLTVSLSTPHCILQWIVFELPHSCYSMDVMFGVLYNIVCANAPCLYSWQCNCPSWGFVHHCVNLTWPTCYLKLWTCMHNWHPLHRAICAGNGNPNVPSGVLLIIVPARHGPHWNRQCHRHHSTSQSSTLDWSNWKHHWNTNVLHIIVPAFSNAFNIVKLKT